MSDSKFDAVSKPKHYNLGGIECIDAMRAATVGLEGIEAVDTAQVIKYIWRWKHKNGVEDLKKCRWYLDHLIKELTRATSLSTAQQMFYMLQRADSDMRGHDTVVEDAIQQNRLYPNPVPPTQRGAEEQARLIAAAQHVSDMVQPAPSAEVATPAPEVYQQIQQLERKYARMMSDHRGFDAVWEEALHIHHVYRK